MNALSGTALISGIAALFNPLFVLPQVAATFANDALTGDQIDRLEQRIKFEVTEIKRTALNFDLATDSRFIRGVEAAIQLSNQTIQAEKIDLYARILARSTAETAAGTLDTAPVIMRIVSAATTDELLILGTLASKLSRTQQELDSHTLSKSLNGKHEKDVELLLYGLSQLGLVKHLRDKANENKTFGVWNVTPLGERVVRLTAKAHSS